MRSSRASLLRGGAAACAVLLVAALGPTLPASGVAPARAFPQAARAATITDWHLAPSLARLRAEIDARWPERSRASDGALGDLRHRKSRNSHNPVGHKRGPEHGSPGSVHALDVTAAGIDTDAVLAAVIGDPRVWYVIFDGRIWSRTTGWAARRQSGDPHTTHIHISLRDRSQSVAVTAERDTSRWLSRRSGSGGSRSAKLGTRATVSLQKSLISRGYRIPSGPTGWYGPETTKAVRAFQRDQGWSGPDADGKAGAQTLRRLGVTTSDGSSTKSAKKKPKKEKKKAAKKKSAKKKAAKKKAAKRGKKRSAEKKSAPAKKSATTRSKAGRYVPGTASVAVYYLQEALIERGYSIPAGPTGYFGTRTVAAVEAFQRAQGWSGKRADGVPGRATLSRLGLD